MEKSSTIKFNDFEFEKNSYIKVIWNNKIIFDDTLENENPELCGLERLRFVDKLYGDKIVYEMDVKIVSFHHTILNIKGEKVDESKDL